MAFHDFEHQNMVPAKAGTTKVQIVYTTEDGILICRGKTKPVDTTAGYAPGCIFQHIDGSGSSDVLFVNVGTNASCNFDATSGSAITGGQDAVTTVTPTAVLTGVDTSTYMTAAQAATIIADILALKTAQDKIIANLVASGIQLVVS